MANPVPLMLISPDICSHFAKPFERLAIRFERFFTGLKKDLVFTDLTYHWYSYVAYSFINALFMFFLLFFLFFILNLQVKGEPFFRAFTLGFALGTGMFLVFMILLLRYPKILGGKKVEAIERDLLYLLKDLLLQISSGVSIHNAIINVSLADYGTCSLEFKRVARKMNAGKPLAGALEDLVMVSKSEYIKKTCWQLINTLKAGASVKIALRSIIDELVLVQRTKIRDYAQELNLWSLLYMLFAVAIPTIGATMLVILSSFAGFGVTQGTFIFFVALAFIIQIILITFIKTKRPNVAF